MNELGRRFRTHVMETCIPDCTITAVDDDHITLTTPTAVGEVIFYAFNDQPEIVELRIANPECDCEPKFFLHFELEDEARANELFDEMASELEQHERYDTTHVLLCCTAGLTTSMFAAKLSEAAQTLSLDYTFDAIPLDQAQAQGGDYDAVLLAPQVGYQRAAVAKAFPNAVVAEIPAKVFASFDAGRALHMAMHLLGDTTVFPSNDAENLKFVRELKNDKRIMVITIVNRPHVSWIGWRMYDRGEIKAHGSVTKPKHDLRDVEDLLATMHFRGYDPGELDAIGLAVPGVVNRGSVAFTSRNVTDYELGRTLSKRYGTKVFVDNNANAAAVGCYMSQDKYDSVVMHTQQTGYFVGGQGIVVDGHLLKGRRNFAGELSPLFGAVHTPYRDQRSHLDPWTSEGMRKIVAPILAADVSLVAPDAIYVAVDLLDDTDALRDEMNIYFGEKNEQYIPDLIPVSDYRERIALGELALCLQKLSNPRPHRKH